MTMLAVQAAATGAITSLQDAKALAKSIGSTREMKSVARSLGKDVVEVNGYAKQVVVKKQALGEWYKSLPNERGIKGRGGADRLSERSDDLTQAKAQQETGLTRQTFSKFVHMSQCPAAAAEHYYARCDELQLIIKEVVIESIGRELFRDEVTDEMRQLAVDKIVDLEVIKEADARSIIKDIVRSVKDAQALETIEKAEDAEPAEHVQEGQFWKLGDHILYCGNTASDEFVSFLRDMPYKATFAFADPPYGADVADWDKEFYWEHDYLIDVADTVAVTPGIVSIFEFAQLTTMPYKWSHATWITNGMTRGALGFGNWIYTALFATDKKHLGTNQQDFFKVEIDVSKTSETSHRGRKPLRMIIELVNMFGGLHSDDRTPLIIDPFGGSGTTLLACQSCEVPCITGEISPDYCKAIIGRWEKLSGLKAEVMS
jgi:16S rRNA G966 N2-methylase RsmD